MGKENKTVKCIYKEGGNWPFWTGLFVPLSKIFADRVTDDELEWRAGFMSLRRDYWAP